MHSRFLRFVDTSLLLAAGFTVSGVPTAFAQVYEVEGSLKYSVGEAHIPRFTRQFILTVSNCAWAIRLSSEDFDGAKYYHVVHAADSIFYYTRFGRLPPGANFVNNGTAVIEKGDAPVENGTFANYVWAGLASACYFGQRTNAEVRPLWLVSDKSSTVRCSVEFLDAYPFLPKRVTYFQNAGLLPAPFDGGWRAAVIQVGATTNMGDVTVPLKFTYDQHKPMANARTSDDVESQMQVTVEVGSVTLTPRNSTTPPHADGITLIEERRLGVDGVTYAFSNAVLPSVPEKIALDRAKALKAASGAAATTVPRRAALVVFFVVSLGVLLLSMFRKRKPSE